MLCLTCIVKVLWLSASLYLKIASCLGGGPPRDTHFLPLDWAKQDVAAGDEAAGKAEFDLSAKVIPLFCLLLALLQPTSMCSWGVHSLE